MMDIRAVFFRIILPVLLLTAVSASMSHGGGRSPDSSSSPSSNVQGVQGAADVKGTGTIKYISLEGGFYGIVADDGQNYLPRNLSQEFKVDGLRVVFEAKILKGVATIYMWGTPVDLLRIERL